MSNNRRIRILIVGIGALRGTIATRAVSAGMSVWLATRTAKSARVLRSSGLRVSGNGYVAQLGRKIGIPIALNAAMTDMINLIEQGQIQPHPARLDDLLRRVSFSEKESG